MSEKGGGQAEMAAMSGHDFQPQKGVKFVYFFYFSIFLV